MPSGAATRQTNFMLATPASSHPLGYDADNDGMKDEWEAKHGGNLVWNADFDNDGYINLVEFINGVLDAMAADGRWAALYDKHIKPYTGQEAPEPPLDQ